MVYAKQDGLKNPEFLACGTSEFKSTFRDFLSMIQSRLAMKGRL